MNALEEFYLKLDNSDWDAKQEGEISVQLLNVSETLLKEGLLDVQHFAEVDRQVFPFNSSSERKRSYKPIGSNSQKDLDHLYQRFRETKNVYAKTEYGLLFYYSKKEHENEFVEELLNALFTLLKSYIDKIRPKEDYHSYVISYIRPLLANILGITHAHNNQRKQKIDEFYKSLIGYLFETQQSWDIKHHSVIVILMIFTDFFVEYFNDFKSYLDFKKIIDKNWQTAKYLSEKDAKEPLYIIDPTMQLCKKFGIDDKPWKNFKAQQYEEISSVLLARNNNMVAMSYIEKSLKLYKELKDHINTNRLEQQYQQLRSETQLNDVVFDFPIEESKRIDQLIKNEIQNLDEEDIIKTLLSTTPMFLLPLTKIREENKSSLQSSSLFNIFHTVIYDKFGNVIDQLKLIEKNEEKNDKIRAERNDKIREVFSLNQAYRLHMQIALQTITHFFIEAFYADKISSKSIIDYLKKTWIGQDSVRKIYGKEITVSHLKLVESGINAFFKELNQSKNDPQYLPDLICVTDSLTLKGEYLLRQICGFWNIKTFQPKKEGIVMERLLDEILKDLEKILPEDDHFFIKYILTSKAGYNLRNEIAHGLMDNIEYSIGYPILAIIIILKLSKPDFAQL